VVDSVASGDRPNLKPPVLAVAVAVAEPESLAAGAPAAAAAVAVAESTSAISRKTVKECGVAATSKNPSSCRACRSVRKIVAMVWLLLAGAGLGGWLVVLGVAAAAAAAAVVAGPAAAVVDARGVALDKIGVADARLERG
jgi:hypothetical protein